MRTSTSIPGRRIGGIWILLSPILLVMAGISTLESETAYYVQLGCFGAVSAVGLISGVALVANRPWPRPILEALSWLGFTYFAGSGLMVLAVALRSAFETEPRTLAALVAVSFGICATGTPFFLMARGLNRARHIDA
jgi:hypothetical protein